MPLPSTPKHTMPWSMLTLVLLLFITEGACADTAQTMTSANCSTAVARMIQSAFSGDRWALEMMDASSKPPIGLMQQGFRFPLNWEPVPLGSSHFLGNYDQCLNVETTKDFGTSYCRAEFYFNKLGNAKLSPPSRVFADVCVPDVCTGDDLVPIIQHYIKNIPYVDVTVNNAYCLDTYKPLHWKSKAALVFFSILLFIVAMATIYDVVFVHYCDLFKDKTTITSSETDKRANENADKTDTDDKTSGSTSVQDASPKSGEIWSQILLSFSLYTNIPSMLSTSQSKGGLASVNGVRVVATAWIVWGHIYYFAEPTIGNFRDYWTTSDKKMSFQFIVFFHSAVDIFFVLSFRGFVLLCVELFTHCIAFLTGTIGLLVTYNSMKQLKTKGPSLAYFKRFYFHRICRLTPPYLSIVLIYAVLIKHASDGPLWPRGDGIAEECTGSFLPELFYLNNFDTVTDICPAWTWSLSMDMQFFFISPVILLALYYFPKRGLILPLAMMVATMSFAGYSSYTNRLLAVLSPSDFLKLFDYMEHFYMTPFTRIGPYLVGMVTGYLLYITDGKAKLSKSFVIIGWVLCITFIYGAFFAFYGTDIELASNAKNSLFNALNRTMFGMSISWIVFACTCGYGGIVNKILSSNFLAKFTPISYCTFLSHPVVLRYFFFSQRRLLYFSDINITFIGIGCLVVTQLVAAIVHLLFEAPFPKLERVIRDNWKGSETKVHKN